MQPDIEELVTAGEGEQLEYKASLPRDAELLRLVLGMANGKGGWIVAGVGDDGRRPGVHVDHHALERLRSYVLDHTDPPLEVSATVQTLGEQQFVVIEVPYGWQKPYFVRGTAEGYVRRGTTVRPTTSTDVQRLAIEGHLGAFEDAPVARASVADLDQSRFEAFLSGRGMPRDHGVGDLDSFTALLRNLGFLVPISDPDAKVEAPTVAALLLFGREPQRYLPQAQIELARFPGQEVATAAERAHIGGTLAEQVHGAIEFITRAMRVSTHVEAFHRTEIPEYPLAAVRELLVNAVVHRDYSLRGMRVTVWMFFDRWEIRSPGAMPGPPRPDDQQRHSIRIARNPRIADAMRVLGWAEGFGIGLDLVRRQSAQAGLPSPVWTEDHTTLTVTLRGADETERRRRRLHQFRTTLDLKGGNQRQLAAIDHLVHYPTLTNAAYRKLVGVSAATAHRDLAELEQHGLIIRHGEKRGSYYTLAENSEPEGA